MAVSQIHSRRSRIALRPNLSVAQAFQIIARACVRHFRINEPLLIASRLAEPLVDASPYGGCARHYPCSSL